MLLPALVYAQGKEYKPYECVATVKDGKRSSGSTVYYVKLDGKTVYIKMLYGENRYKYSGTQSKGNSLYYREVYNNGTINQGSGWVEKRDNYLLISPDKKTINLVDKSYNTTQILKLQTSNSAGDMIY